MMPPEEVLKILRGEKDAYVDLEGQRLFRTYGSHHVVHHLTKNCVKALRGKLSQRPDGWWGLP